MKIFSLVDPVVSVSDETLKDAIQNDESGKMPFPCRSPKPIAGTFLVLQRVFHWPTGLAEVSSIRLSLKLQFIPALIALNDETLYQSQSLQQSVFQWDLDVTQKTQSTNFLKVIFNHYHQEADLLEEAYLSIN